MKRCLLPLLPLLALLSSCSTITTMDGREITDDGPQSGSCQVTVYQTYQAAISLGKIEELCIINGGTAGSWARSIPEVIDRHKTKACACGANAVYVQSRSGNYWTSPLEVTLVAFRYRK